MAPFALILALLALALQPSHATFPMPDLHGLAENIITPLDTAMELGKGAMRQMGPDTHSLLGADESPPHTFNHVKRYGSGAPYWMSQIKRQGQVAYGNASFVIWRNVMDYGAMGDGVTDDTSAINNATAAGDRCGLGCDSSTVTPAIVYFPAGTYIVSAPLIQYYYTQFIGDANNLPTIMATSDFYGIGIFDSDVYLPYGFNWYTNQNNFYRQIRNFVLDITQVPPTRNVHCIHWQVAQATSLQNIVMKMVAGTLGDGNNQFGVFMDNGSGGFLEDLVFYGGGVGFFGGNQQFTCRNLTFYNCETAIFQNWNWVFLYKGITINDCAVGLDLSQGGEVPATGSLVLQDSSLNNVQYGIITSFSSNSTPTAAGTLILDNVNFNNTDPAVQYQNNSAILRGNRVVNSFIQGPSFSAYEHESTEHNLTCYVPTANYSRVQGETVSAPKPASLLTPTGTYVERSRPQYEGVPVESFISIITYGCAGDGLTDDTVCLQNFLNSIGPDEIAYFDHGAYLISETIQIPNDISMQGEIWPLLMVDGSSPTFSDPTNPQVAFRVGNPGDVGTAEIVEFVFETRGPAPGAIILEWNLAGSSPGASGMWDTHWRIGGSNGTLLQSNNCTKDPSVAHGVNPTCLGAFMLLHVTTTGSLLMSNNWGWVADHELDLPDHNQTDIYNGRGVLVESQGPMWMYGTAFEHSQLYNYQFANSKDIFAGVIQAETA